MVGPFAAPCPKTSRVRVIRPSADAAPGEEAKEPQTTRDQSHLRRRSLHSQGDRTNQGQDPLTKRQGQKDEVHQAEEGDRLGAGWQSGQAEAEAQAQGKETRPQVLPPQGSEGNRHRPGDRFGGQRVIRQVQGQDHQEMTIA
jgi:hypothetical protein